MVNIKISKNHQEISLGSIRRQFDQKTAKWQFSVTDVIAIVTKSSDARNYWKVLKNRLKISHNQLVTKCNQLKLLSRDGKYYLTDTLDAETMLELIQLIAGEYVESFREWFNSPMEECLGIAEDIHGARLLIDGYQSETEIFIKAMVAGIPLHELSISVTPSKVIIKGKREAPEKIPKENYLEQELLWTSFFRTISLPSKVKTEGVEINEEGGLLTIKLQKKL